MSLTRGAHQTTADHVFDIATGDADVGKLTIAHAVKFLGGTATVAPLADGVNERIDKNFLVLLGSNCCAFPCFSRLA